MFEPQRIFDKLGIEPETMTVAELVAAICQIADTTRTKGSGECYSQRMQAVAILAELAGQQLEQEEQ